ncbi:leukocyte immunoglobulin-like receptor subfamily A member 6 [Choloepus didactylus]|uniref:leukocyte immunoglobulin-like receptor subfamily A member 6 n=1 Tax=Choloepus didactylus TaxID=27675 RepID=UPI0018A11D27|nr:leukocyte immunoglobulin-like receptor subfamily A member 6 [Choloepus didactylus]
MYYTNTNRSDSSRRGTDHERSFLVGGRDEPLTGNSPPGLRPGRWEHVQAGILPKPSLWADPGSTIPSGSPVTLWCQGSPQADLYHLNKDGASKPWDTQTPLASGDKVRFSIESVSAHTTGRFQCEYSSPEGWSAPSDPLHLVVTGAHSKPSLSAHPSPVALCPTPMWGYGSSSFYPESWSLPSDPVVIEVTENLELSAPPWGNEFQAPREGQFPFREAAVTTP